MEPEMMEIVQNEENDDQEEITNLNRIKTNVVSVWENKFQSGNLSDQDIWTHWQTWIGQVFFPKETANYSGPHINHNVLDIVLIQSLEDFVLGNEKERIKLLTDNHQLSSVCGEIFKAGDIYFRCDGCSGDPTCVLCINCFRKSAHKNHKYIIATSTDGGGCCDCGDTFSWKCEPYCEDHQSALTTINSIKLPQDVLTRAELVISSVVRFSFEMSSYEHKNVKSHSSYLKAVKGIPIDEKLFCTVLSVFCEFPTHLDERVASKITKVKKCSLNESIALVKHCNEVGRSILMYSSYKKCDVATKEIKNCFPFKIHTSRWDHVCRQEFALFLLKWLEKFIRPIKELRDIFTKEGLNLNNDKRVIYSVGGSKMSIVEGMLLNDSKLWKTAKESWHNLFLSGLLLDHDNKIVFAEKFVDQYQTLVENYNEFSDNLVNHFSVQIFTVPLIAHHLITKKNILTILLQTYTLEYSKQQEEMAASFSNAPFYFNLNIILNDLTYILGSMPKDWSQELSDALLNAVSFSLNILSRMQNLYPSMKDDIINGALVEMKMQCDFLSVLNQLLSWCAADQRVLLKCFKMTLKTLHESNRKCLNNNYEIKHFAGHSAKCFVYEVLSKPVSFLCPLSRFFASLYLHLQSFSYNLNSPDFSLVKPSPEELLELVLRIQAFIALLGEGTTSDLSFMSVVYSYKKPKQRVEMFSADITMFQISASLMESNSFLIHILNKFDILDWANEHFDAKECDDVGKRSIMSVSEKFLFLLLAIIGERYKQGMSTASQIDCLKYELMHRLFLKPCTHSELSGVFRNINKNNQDIDLDSIINDIATFDKPMEASKSGVFKIKDELIDRFNVFYMNYSQEELLNAEENQKKRRKQLGKIECCPPPHLSPFSPSFKPLSYLLNCDVMLQIITTVLKRSLSQTMEMFSHLQLQQVLHLIGYALQEEVDDIHLKFIKSDETWGIKSYLQKLLISKNAYNNRHLIQWLLNKYRLLSNEIDQVTNNESESSENVNKVDEEKEAFHSRAAKRKAILMAQMSSQQQNFYKNFIDANDLEDPDANCSKIKKPISQTCILCREDSIISLKGSSMICVAFVKNSGVFPEIDEQFGLPILKQKRVHINTCGHYMHYNCWEKYVLVDYEKINKHPRWPLWYDPAYQEYSCPLCKNLGNTVLPLVPRNCINDKKNDQISFTDWINSMRNSIDKTGTCKNNQISKNKFDSNDIYCNCEECVKYHYSSLSKSIKKTEIFKKWDNFFSENISTDVNKTICLFITSLKSNESLKNTEDIFSNEYSISLWKCCSYSIRVLVEYFICSDKHIFDAVSSSQEICTTNLIILSTLCSMYKSPKGHYAARNTHKEIISHLLNSYESDLSFMNCECFELFILLTMTSHSFENKSFSQGVVFDNNLFLLILYLNFAQIIISLDENSLQATENIIDDETECLNDILKLFKNYNALNTIEMWKCLKESSMPLLKCCTIFFRFLNDIPPSQELMEVDGITFENILCFIGIPFGCNELLGKTDVYNLYKTWSQHFSKYKSSYTNLNVISTNYKKLINLPEDYFQLIATSEHFACSNCAQKGLKHLSLCLICGAFVCMESACCKNKSDSNIAGPCSNHAETCGKGIGIFIVLRWSSVLLLSLNPRRCCLVSGPYLDRYGESDHGLYRGNPLKLNKEKYFDLQLSWLSHSIPEIIYRRFDETSINYQMQQDQWLLQNL